MRHCSSCARRGEFVTLPLPSMGAIPSPRAPARTPTPERGARAPVRDGARHFFPGSAGMTFRTVVRVSSGGVRRVGGGVLARRPSHEARWAPSRGLFAFWGWFASALVPGWVFRRPPRRAVGVALPAALTRSHRRRARSWFCPCRIAASQWGGGESEGGYPSGWLSPSGQAPGPVLVAK